MREIKLIETVDHEDLIHYYLFVTEGKIETLLMSTKNRPNLVRAIAKLLEVRL